MKDPTHDTSRQSTWSEKSATRGGALSFFDFMSEMLRECAKEKEAISLTLRRADGQEATLGFAHDRLTHASTDGLTGEQAFYEIMSWDAGEIVDRIEHYAPVNINVSLTRILLDAYWYLRRHTADSIADELHMPARALGEQVQTQAVEQRDAWYSALSERVLEIDDLAGHVILGARNEIFIDQGGSIERARRLIGALPTGERIAHVLVASDRRHHLLFSIDSRDAWLYAITYSTRKHHLDDMITRLRAITREC